MNCTMHSCIYEGRVRHRRFSPIKHHFNYKLFMMYLDLDELSHLFEKYWLWSCERSNVAQFQRKDHIGNPIQPLKESAYDLVEAHCGKRLTGPIRLLTHLRYFGYRINPVSFYYCYDEKGSKIEAIIHDVLTAPIRLSRNTSSDSCLVRIVKTNVYILSHPSTYCSVSI